MSQERTRPSRSAYDPNKPISPDNHPEWLMYVEKGAAKITIEYPTEFSGVLTDTIVMRRPKVKDRMDAETTYRDKTDTEKELYFFTTLTDLTPDDIGELDFKDYLRMQAAFRSFLSSAPATK